MKTISELFIKHFSVIFVLGIGVFSVLNLFQPGFFPSHDGEYHIIRYYEFNKTFLEGNWYPLWAADLNYTYGLPLFNYVYPLSNYVSSLFHFLGISFVDSFKLSLITASIIGSVTSYIYGREIFGRWGGVLTSVFYTLAPYHLLDVYIRGSIGEVWALALFPLCLYLFDKAASLRKPRIVALASISYSLVIFSHNILALMFTMFLVCYSMFLVLSQNKKKKAAIALCLSLMGGLSLSSVFIVPAIFEQQYVTGLKIYDVLENFPEIYQLLIPSWGSGFSGESSFSQMSFQIGVVNLFVIFIVILGFLKKKVKNKFILFYLATFFVLFFMMTSYSSFIWQKVTIIQYFQFPWRLLSLVILCCAVLAGSITLTFKSKILNILLLTMIFLTTVTYAKAPYFWNRKDSHYTSKENFLYGSNSVGNAFQTKWLIQQKELPEKNKDIILKESKTTRRVYEVNSEKEKNIIFNLAYFPGWKTLINGKELEAININGRVGVSIPSGKTNVTLILRDTSIRYLAKTISIAVALIIALILLRPAMIQYFHAHRDR